MMSVIRNVEGKKNTYEWKIGDLKAEGLHFSPVFKVNGYPCFLSAISYSENFLERTCWGFWLNPTDLSFYPLHYKVSVVDSKRRNILFKRGIMEESLLHQQLLLFMHEKELIERNLMKSDSLTLRLTFKLIREPHQNRNLATGKKKSSSGFCAVQRRESSFSSLEENSSSGVEESSSSNDSTPKTFPISRFDASSTPIQPFQFEISSSGIKGTAAWHRKTLGKMNLSQNDSWLRHETYFDSETNNLGDQNKTGEKPDETLETVSNDFRTSCKSEMDTHCILENKEKRLLVHRAVLSACSAGASFMCLNFTAESVCKLFSKAKIPWKSFSNAENSLECFYRADAKTISDILYYIYSGKIQGLTSDNDASTYTVDDKAVLLKLSGVFLNLLKFNLTIDNIYDAIFLAHVHGDLELQDRIHIFIENSLEDLLQSEKWKAISSLRPTCAYKLLSSAFLASKKRHVQEETV